MNKKIAKELRKVTRNAILTIVCGKNVQAYAAVKFADACLRGLRGDAGIVECAFVFSEVCILHPSYHSLFHFSSLNNAHLSHDCLVQVTELPFFASKVRLGRTGVEEVYSLGPLNEYERYVITSYESLT